MNIAVIGAGYVGLVVGTCFSDLGFRVDCTDNDPAKIEALVRGAPGRLRPGGCLWLVAQECVPVGAVFNAAGASLYRCAPPARHA